MDREYVSDGMSTGDTPGSNRVGLHMLMVTPVLERPPSGGREKLSLLNHDILEAMFGERFLLEELPDDPRQGVSVITAVLKGYIDGVTQQSIRSILDRIETEAIDRVFIDGSNLGELARAIEEQTPDVEVTTFFHNVEARFFLGALRRAKTFHALGVLLSNHLAERKAVQHSDRLICLSERDSQLLRRLYGRTATHISPIAVRDQLPPPPYESQDVGKDGYALFVGGAFYANRQGVEWYIEEVAPHVDIDTCIVGRGFGEIRDELKPPANVDVVGEVEDLAPWYANARFVVAPILDGSGMKTKVAEALMFGKRVVGTPEAFTGYEEISRRVGWVCESAEEFADATNLAKARCEPGLSKELRGIYEKNYSYDAALDRMRSILGS